LDRTAYFAAKIIVGLVLYEIVNCDRISFARIGRIDRVNNKFYETKLDPRARCLKRSLEPGCSLRMGGGNRRKDNEREECCEEYNPAGEAPKVTIRNVGLALRKSKVP
jgi:hypothetical protein